MTKQTVYCVAGYSYGSTNGQRPVGHVIVVGAADKATAVEAGRKALGSYKASASLRKSVEAAQQHPRFMRMPDYRVIEL